MKVLLAMSVLCAVLTLAHSAAYPAKLLGYFVLQHKNKPDECRIPAKERALIEALDEPPILYHEIRQEGDDYFHYDAVCSFNESLKVGPLKNGQQINMYHPIDRAMYVIHPTLKDDGIYYDVNIPSEHRSLHERYALGDDGNVINDYNDSESDVKCRFYYKKVDSNPCTDPNNDELRYRV